MEILGAGFEAVGEGFGFGIIAGLEGAVEFVQVADIIGDAAFFL